MGWLERIKRRLGWEPPFAMDEMSDRMMIVGLGNPGPKYENTRHNIGFAVINRLAAEYGIDLTRVQKNAMTGFGRIADRQVLLVKPLTYMNRSGDSVGPLADYYRIDAADILVVYDDLDLPFGTIRLREKGSAGGHNGMKSLIQHLGSDLARLRIGVGRPTGRLDAAAYVLLPFRAEESAELDILLAEAVKAVTTFVTDGIQLAMTRHNATRNP